MALVNIVRRLQNISPKQLLVAGVFTVALAGAIGLGNQVKQNASAATPRSCSPNSVDYQDLNGGCGAMSAQELIADIRTNNPSDLQTTYSHFGLTPDTYDRFAMTARQGIAYQNGDVVVDGQVVMRNAWSIGRSHFSYSTAYPIGNTTFYKSAHTNVLKSNHDAMVMFDDEGTAEFFVLNACGNAGNGEKVISKGTCRQLNMDKVEGKNNTYSFTSDIELVGNATLDKVVYIFSDGTREERTNPKEAVEHTFKQSGTARVEAHIKLPGGKIKIISGDNCVKSVTVKIPFFQCVVLTPTVRNEEETMFRFTVTTSQGNGAELKDVDFMLDGSATTTGVTTKDEDGRIYKEYTFTDDKEHKVKATANFTVDGKVESHTSPNCEAKATAKKKPVCPISGKENLPPEECKETKPEVMPVTGIGNLFGLFAGTSAAGAVAHRVYVKRRNR